MQEKQRDIVWDGAVHRRSYPEAQFRDKLHNDSKRQHHLRRSYPDDEREGERDTHHDSPRFLTIEVPKDASKRQMRADRPPIEIVIGEPGGGTNTGHLPRTIEVKGAFCPPQEIVVVDTSVGSTRSSSKGDSRSQSSRIPGMIQVSDNTKPGKSKASREKRAKEKAAKEERRAKRTDAAKAQKKRSEQKLVQAFDNFQTRAAAPQANKSAPDEREILPTVTDAPKDMPILPKDEEMNHSESQIQAIVPKALHIHNNTRPLEQRPCPDPPAAKAETTSRHVLPDFSDLAHSNHKRRHHPRMHRKNVLDESNYNNNLLHQSWPVTGMQIDNSNSSNNNMPGRRRIPQWLGVTGTAEDWIKPEEVQQIGRKIASQRLEI